MKLDVAMLTHDLTQIPDYARKVEIATRIHDIVTKEYGLQSDALIFDDLTFTLATGDAEFRRSAIETIDGIRGIKSALPGVLTSLGRMVGISRPSNASSTSPGVRKPRSDSSVAMVGKTIGSAPRTFSSSASAAVSHTASESSASWMSASCPLGTAAAKKRVS